MQQREMTTGSPARIILGFTIPIFIGNVFQQFYSMVDTIIVGQFVGNGALAAVGATGTISFLILGFLMGLTAGFTVLTAQRFGAGDREGMRKSVGSAAVLSAAGALVMTVVSMIFMRRLLVLMNTPEDIFEMSYSYIMIICGGIFAQVLYNLLASILRALGNSRTPLFFLVFAAILNIVLDLLFIIVFKMGVQGAAYATVISQGVSGVLCLFYIIKKVPDLHLQARHFKLDGHLVRVQLTVGIPMALQYSITAVGTMMVQSALNVLGSLAVAAFTTANKIESLLTQMYVALGTTMATYCAQNIGAGRIDRIRGGARAATILTCIYSVVIGALVFTVGKYMTVLFTTENLDQIMGYADIYLKCTGIFFIPLGLIFIYRNGIQGMGYGVLPMTAGIVELAARAVTAVAASRHRSFWGICMSDPAAWVAAGVFLVIVYFILMRKHPLEKKSVT